MVQIIIEIEYFGIYSLYTVIKSQINFIPLQNSRFDNVQRREKGIV